MAKRRIQFSILGGQMRLLCKDNHWSIKDGVIYLGGSEDQAKSAAKLQAVMEARIRLDIYNAICDMPLLENRKAITKAGIDNVALSVQALCADIALGGK
jgi:hypothetical protein